MSAANTHQNLFFNLGDPPLLKHKTSANFFKSSALSFAEFSSTAFTSQSGSEGNMSCPVPSSLLSPQPLRKSISVDSFAFRRPALNGLNTTPGPHLSEDSLGSHSFVPEARLDFDGDRYDPQSIAATGRYRQSSSHETFKPLIRGADLPLPSRSQNNAPATPNSIETIPASSPASSPQTVLQESNDQSHSGSSGRIRSGSLATTSSSDSKRILVNADLTLDREDIVMLVLGTPGCSRLRAIRKGLSGYGLRESSTISQDPLYIQRVGHVVFGQPDSSFESSYGLRVIQGEVPRGQQGLPSWPSGLPPVDCVILCYDSSERSTYEPIEGLLKGYRDMRLPVVVLGCKTDQENEEEINAAETRETLDKYDTGLVQVSIADPNLKYKMKRSFDYLLMAVVHQRASTDEDLTNRNPASPAILNRTGSVEKFLNSPATSASTSPLISLPTHFPMASAAVYTPPLNFDAAFESGTQSSFDLADTVTTNQLGSDIPSLNRHNSGARVTQLSPSEQLTPFSSVRQSNSGEKTPVIDPLGVLSTMQTADVDLEDAHPDDESEHSPGMQDDTNHQHFATGSLKKEPKFMQWAKLDELLDKLLFLAVSGDDSTYSMNFLLTYRRFATPRSLLLAMQKRMRQLDNPSGDPVFASFAQTRICHLLETWIHDYPNDFAVKGTFGALNALIKSIISKTHLLHYGSEFLPFLEQIPGLVEQDAAWSLKAETLDSDSVYNDEEEEEEAKTEQEERIIDDTSSLVSMGTFCTTSLLLDKTIHQNVITHSDPSPKQLLKDLVKLSNEVLVTDAEEIAQEITRHCARQFLIIKPRDWLHFTYVSKKDESHPLVAYNIMCNRLAEWAISLILCHDRPRNRARLIDKIVDVAQKIRQMNNYSGLRALIAGINIAADDVTMEVLKNRFPEASKNLQSWDVLLKQMRSHRAYRMALRNSKGSCIPALEVHMQDLIKANEGNADSKDGDPTLIHWGKFSVLARVIHTVTECQTQCRTFKDYDFPERPSIAELFVKRPLMSPEMQQMQLNVQYDDDEHSAPLSSGHRDTTGLRKLFAW